MPVEFDSVYEINRKMPAKNYYNSTFENCTFSQEATFTNCIFWGCDVSNISSENLMGCYFQPSKRDYFENLFETTPKGIITVKGFNWWYPPSKEWRLRKGSTIKERPDKNVSRPCGEGINVGNRCWLLNDVDSGFQRHNLRYSKPTIGAWVILIPWESEIILPVNCLAKPNDRRIKMRVSEAKLLQYRRWTFSEIEDYDRSFLSYVE